MTVLSQLVPFQGFEREDLMSMVDAMSLAETTAGQIVVQEGQEMDFFCIVEHGKFQFFHNGQQMGQVKNVGHFTEVALVYDVLSEHTVVSASNGQLWVLPRIVYRDLLVQREATHRIRLAAILDAAPILKRLPAETLALLCQSFTTLTLENACIVNDWAGADSFYLVEEGTVVVRVRQPDSAQLIDYAVYGRGSTFGALSEVPSTLMIASVHAMGVTRCSVLNMRIIHEVLGPNGLGTDADAAMGNLTI